MLVAEEDESAYRVRYDSYVIPVILRGYSGLYSKKLDQIRDYIGHIRAMP